MKQQIQTNKIEWREVELGSVLEEKKFAVVDGPFGTQLHASDYTGAGIPVIRIKNITKDNLFDEDDLVYISDKKFKELERSAVFPNDIILAKTGATIGKVCILPNRIKKALIASSCAKISVNKDKISAEYVKLFLSTERGQAQILSQSGGSTRSSINLNPIRKLEIPLPFRNGQPDLEEQQRIVAILEQAERLKEQGKRASALLDEYLKSVFYEMFGDPVKNNKGWNQDNLENICDKITDGEHATPTLTTKGVPYISAKNVNEIIDFEDIKYVDEETYKKITKRCLPEYGDILITCVGTIGRVKRIDIKERFVFARSIALIKPNRLNISNIFLEKMLSLPSMKRYMIGNTNEATVKGLYLKQINRLEVIVPPLSLQQKFASIVEHVEKMKENVKKTQANSEELFNSLMQKAFRGEL
ncbi:MAG: restriction endonuclease subunit S [Nanoarchaeota archaeon]